MKFSIKDFISMWPNLQFLPDLVTFTKEILNGKLHFLGSADCTKMKKHLQIQSLKLLFPLVHSTVETFLQLVSHFFARRLLPDAVLCLIMHFF